MSTQYLKSTVQILVHFTVSSIFFVLLNPISASIIFITTYLIPDVIDYDKEYSSIGEEVKSADINEFASNICKEYGMDSTNLRKTSGSSGILIQRIWNPDIILVPKSTNPEEPTDEALAVVAHELSHKNNRDSLVSYLLVLTASVFVGLVSPIIYGYGIPILIAFLSFTSIITPLVLNYLSHRSEYKADSFASQKVNERAVLKRLRRNNDLKIDGKFKYKTSHPEVESRISRIREDD